MKNLFTTEIIDIALRKLLDAKYVLCSYVLLVVSYPTFALIVALLTFEDKVFVRRCKIEKGTNFTDGDTDLD